jgi:hypothetical protein
LLYFGAAEESIMTGTSSSSTNFWTTMPGILTGIAAVVTAITGLILGMAQYGGKDRSAIEESAPSAAATGQTESTAPAADPGNTTTRTIPSEPVVRGAPTVGEKKEPTVVITARDGVVTTVYEKSFRHLQTRRDLLLLSGQSIGFDRIKAINVKPKNESEAAIDVTLVNGGVHSGTVPIGSVVNAFAGENDLGKFEILIENLARVSFER